jgi:hypothetical protein
MWGVNLAQFDLIEELDDEHARAVYAAGAWEFLQHSGQKRPLFHVHGNIALLI